MDAINATIDRHPRWGFWKMFKALRHNGHELEPRTRVSCLPQPEAEPGAPGEEAAAGTV